jgi:hypothetical protein
MEGTNRRDIQSTDNEMTPMGVGTCDAVQENAGCGRDYSTAIWWEGQAVALLHID